VTQCSVDPACLSSTCRLINSVERCSLPGGGNGVCDRGACMPEAALARACFEGVVLDRYPFSGQRKVYGRGCPTEECLQQEARVARIQNAQVGRALATCFLVGSGRGMPAVDWNLDAPYANSFPGLKKEDAPAPASSEEAP